MSLDGHAEKGLVLIFDDGRRIELTRLAVEAAARRWLADPESLSPADQASIDFQPCEICPLCDMGGFCHAMYPLVPIAERSVVVDLDTPVVLMVREEAEERPVQTLRTTVQRAMQSVSLLSLTDYCETGKKYARLYRGTSVIMGIEEFAHAVAGNIREEAAGDPEVMRTLSQQFCEDLQTTSQGQIGRLRLLCEQDALLNAVVNTLILLECQVEEEAEAELSRTVVSSI